MDFYSEKITIPCTKIIRFVKDHELLRIESLQNYCKVYLVSGELLVSTQNLSTYISKLNKSSFFHCHKSHLINLEHLEAYDKSGFVVLYGEVKVPVSRRRRKDFIELINSIMLTTH